MNQTVNDPFAGMTVETAPPRSLAECFYCNGPATLADPLVIRRQDAPLNDVAYHQGCDDREVCPEAFYNRFEG